MKILITILILLICSGCSSIQRVAPWHKTVYEIRSTPYCAINNDCLDKAQAFQEQIGGKIINVQLRRSPGVNHALIHYIDDDGKHWIIDCTNGKRYQTTDFRKTVLLHYGKIEKYNYKEDT